MEASAKKVLAVLTGKCLEGPLDSTEKQQAPPPKPVKVSSGTSKAEPTDEELLARLFV